MTDFLEKGPHPFSRDGSAHTGNKCGASCMHDEALARLAAQRAKTAELEVPEDEAEEADGPPRAIGPKMLGRISLRRKRIS